MHFSNLFDLNEQQIEAVVAGQGPVLVYAGPGTGKTRVLVSRYAYLLMKDANPLSSFKNNSSGVTSPVSEDNKDNRDNRTNEESSGIVNIVDEISSNDLGARQSSITQQLTYENILAVTFSNRSANELHERIEKSIDYVEYNRYKAWIGTFHSICLRILRTYWSSLGNQNDSSKSGVSRGGININDVSRNIIDTRDQVKLVKEILSNNSYQVDSYKNVLSFIDRIKECPEIAFELYKNDVSEESVEHADISASNPNPSNSSNISNISNNSNQSGSGTHLSSNFFAKLPQNLSNKFQHLLKKWSNDFSNVDSLLNIFSHYQKHLYDNRLMDFNDIIIYAVDLMRKDERLLNFYQNQFKHILVDEYQDTNSLQREFLYLLLNQNQNIFCVGDENQSIYEWRGANGSMSEFKKRFENAQVVYLIQNYRSTEQILKTAEKLINNNSCVDVDSSGVGYSDSNGSSNCDDRLDISMHNSSNLSCLMEAGTEDRTEIAEYSEITDTRGTAFRNTHSQNVRLISANNLVGDTVKVHGFRDSINEAHFVIDKIEFYVRCGYKHSSFAILVRNNSQIRLFEQNMLANKIPYKIVGDMKLYDFKEIKDILAYLRCISNVNDNLSFERIVNVPRRGLGTIFWSRLCNFSKFSIANSSMQLSAQLFISDNSLSSSQRTQLKRLMNLIAEFRNVFSAIGVDVAAEDVDAGGSVQDVAENAVENMKNESDVNESDLDIPGNGNSGSRLAAKMEMQSELNFESNGDDKSNDMRNVENDMVDAKNFANGVSSDLSDVSERNLRAEYGAEECATEGCAERSEERAKYSVVMKKLHESARDSDLCRNIVRLVVNSGYYDFCLEQNRREMEKTTQTTQSIQSNQASSITQSNQSNQKDVEKDASERNKLEECSSVSKIVDFINVCSNFSSLTELLDFVTVNANATFVSGDQNVVSIMTIHSAKGLEFDNVFLPGWENGIIPSIRSIDNGLHEEKRLAYVGITRAKSKLFITYAHNRQIEGFWRSSSRSVFIDMFMNDAVDFKDFYTNDTSVSNASVNNARRTNDGRAVRGDMNFGDKGQNFGDKRQGGTRFSKNNQGSDGELKVGSIVSHDKFGVGVVSSISGDIAQVRFGEGIRNIMISFLKQ